jgi:hypothetical protein
MGKADFSTDYSALTADQAVELWPYLKMYIKVTKHNVRGWRRRMRTAPPVRG